MYSRCLNICMSLARSILNNHISSARPFKLVFIIGSSYLKLASLYIAQRGLTVASLDKGKMKLSMALRWGAWLLPRLIPGRWSGRSCPAWCHAYEAVDGAAPRCLTVASLDAWHMKRSMATLRALPREIDNMQLLLRAMECIIIAYGSEFRSNCIHLFNFFIVIHYSSEYVSYRIYMYIVVSKE